MNILKSFSIGFSFCILFAIVIPALATATESPPPTFTVVPIQSTKKVTPGATMSYVITLASVTDNIIEVTVDITECPALWSPYLSETNVILEYGQEQKITFSVTPPNTADPSLKETMKLTFTPRLLSGGNSTDPGPVIPLTLTTGEESQVTPGYELFFFLGSLGIAILLNRGRKRLKKQTP